MTQRDRKKNKRVLLAGLLALILPEKYRGTPAKRRRQRGPGKILRPALRVSRITGTASGSGRAISERKRRAEAKAA
jgi:hypothetical protein